MIGNGSVTWCGCIYDKQKRRAGIFVILFTSSSSSSSVVTVAPASEIFRICILTISRCLTLVIDFCLGKFIVKMWKWLQNKIFKKKKCHSERTNMRTENRFQQKRSCARHWQRIFPLFMERHMHSLLICFACRRFGSIVSRTNLLSRCSDAIRKFLDTFLIFFFFITRWRPNPFTPLLILDRSALFTTFSVRFVESFAVAQIIDVFLFCFWFIDKVICRLLFAREKTYFPFSRFLALLIISFFAFDFHSETILSFILLLEIATSANVEENQNQNKKSAQRRKKEPQKIENVLPFAAFVQFSTIFAVAQDDTTIDKLNLFLISEMRSNFESLKWVEQHERKEKREEEKLNCSDNRFYARIIERRRVNRHAHTHSYPHPHASVQIKSW